MVDLIRAGKAPEVVRRKGAEGNLPLPVEEKIEILTLLAGDADAELRAQAQDTLSKWDTAEISRVLANPLTAHGVLSFAAEHLVAGREELRKALLGNPSLLDDARHKLEKSLAPDQAADTAKREYSGSLQAAPTRKPDTEEAPAEILAQLTAELPQAGAPGLEPPSADAEIAAEITKRDDELTSKDRETLIQKISRMPAVEKIKAALTGNMETRMLLIRDPNKIVSRAVLQSPKLSDSEVEGYAAAKNVSEEVLRLIAANRKFMRTYVVMRALLNNPRSPIDITMPLISRLNERDLKGLSLNRNVPEVIRSIALKAIKQKEEASKPKVLGKH